MSARSYARDALRSLRRSEDGQTMAEYAVVLSMITIGIVGVFAALSEGVRSALQAVGTAI
jgi:Flp pilus assembly pilin Flp